MGNEEFSDKMNLRNYTKRGSTTVVAEMKTTRTLESLKHDNDRNFAKGLNEATVFIQLNKWQKEAYTSIGIFFMRHPTITWKADMEEDIRERIGEAAKKEVKGEQTNTTIRKGIPKFVFYHDKRFFERDRRGYIRRSCTCSAGKKTSGG